MTTAGQLDIWTVPADAEYILRDVIIGNSAGVAGNVTLFLRPGSQDLYQLFSINGLGSAVSAHLECRQELLAGEQLVVATAVVPLTVLVTGYRFELPA